MDGLAQLDSSTRARFLHVAQIDGCTGTD